MNHDEDTERQEETTGQGYPEEGQPGMGIDAREHAEDDVTPDDDTPETSADQDGDPQPGDGQSAGRGRLKSQWPRALRLFDIS